MCERLRVRRFPALALGIILLCLLEVRASLSHSAEIDQIREAILASRAEWEAGETPISRLLPEERAKRLGTLEPREDLGKGVDKSFALPPLVELPSKFSWKNAGGNFVTQVKDQGFCGSCWAFATTAALESKALITFNRADRPLNLSEQIVLSCTGGENDCDGGYIDQASDFLTTTGTNKERYYPYEAANGDCGAARPDWQLRPYRISGWSWVANGTSPSAETLKNAVYSSGPVVAYMRVFTDFYFYISGIYTVQSGRDEGGHSILIVGWDDAKSAFICKNSWGTGWGEEGFFKIHYSELSGYSQLARWAIAYGDVGLVGVHLIDPNGGEKVASGAFWNIQWEAPPGGASFDLSYSLDNGATWELIERGLTGTEHRWSVPVVPKNTRTCRLRIEEFDASGEKISQDRSDSPFTIEVLGLSSPNGAETVRSEDRLEISWTLNNTIRSVSKMKLFYTLDGGTTWTRIATLPGGGAGSFSYPWSIPSVLSRKTLCKVKVMLLDGSGNSVGSDSSDSPFTILPLPFSGKWKGTWRSDTAGDSGTVIVKILQQGDTFSGTVTVYIPGAVFSKSISGTLSGDSFTVNPFTFYYEGYPITVTASGTRFENTMSGAYTVESAWFYDTGTFLLTKQTS